MHVQGWNPPDFRRPKGVMLRRNENLDIERQAPRLDLITPLVFCDSDL